MKTLLIQSGALFAFATSVAEGRSWEDVIVKAIYQQSGVDVARMQLRVEWDPFNADEGPHSHSLTTLEPTSAPTVGPCHDGAVYHQVNMYDSSGNGWESTKVQVIGIEDQDDSNLSNATLSTSTHKKSTDEGNGFVTVSSTVEFQEGSILSEDPRYATPLGKIFESELLRGSSDYADICLLPRRCYEIVVSGGDLMEEVSWDLTIMDENFEQVATPYMQGKAPIYCKFSIPDVNGEVFCPTSCSEIIPDKYLDKKPDKPSLWDILHPGESFGSQDEGEDGQDQNSTPFQSLFEKFFTPSSNAPSMAPDPERGEGFGTFTDLLNFGQSHNGGKGNEDTEAPSPVVALPTSAPSDPPENLDINNGGIEIASVLKQNTLFEFHQSDRK